MQIYDIIPFYHCVGKHYTLFLTKIPLNGENARKQHFHGNHIKPWKNNVLCRKNYIGLRKNYIRPFFATLQPTGNKKPEETIISHIVALFSTPCSAPPKSCKNRNKDHCRLLRFFAERGGFEPPKRFGRLHAFQACLFNHSSIFP